MITYKCHFYYDYTTYELRYISVFEVKRLLPILKKGGKNKENCTTFLTPLLEAT
jgi:hypothetical protein